MVRYVETFNQVDAELAKQRQIRENILGSSARANSSVYGDASNSLRVIQQAGQTLATQQAQNANRPPQGNIFSLLGQGLQTYAQLKNPVVNPAELKEKQKQVSEAQFAQASVEIERLTASSDDIVQQGAIEDLETIGYDIISKYPQLTPKQTIDLFSKIYSEKGRINRNHFTERKAAIQKARDNVIASERVILTAKLTGILSQIETFPNRSTSLFEQFDSVVKKHLSDNPNLDEISAAQIQNEVYLDFLKSARIGIDSSNELQSRSDNIQAFFNEVQSIAAQFPNNPILAQQKVKEAALLYKIPSSEAIALTDPNVHLRQQLETKKLITQLSEIQEKEYLDIINSQDIERAYVGFKAVQYSNDALVKANIDSDASRGVIEAVAVQNLANDIEKYQEVERRNNLQINSLSRTKAELNQGIQKYRAKNEISQFDEALNNYVQLLENSQQEAVLKALEELKLVRPETGIGLTLEQRAEAQTEMFKWFSLVQGTIDKRIELLANEKQQAYRPLEKYQIDSKFLGDSDYINQLQEQYNLKIQDAQKVLESRNRIQQQTNPQSQQEGVRINFNYGDKKTLVLPIGGKDTPIPFPSDTPLDNIRISSNHSSVQGETRQNHAGVDISAPEGTPVLAMQSGEVSRIQFDENGYGHYIDVTEHLTGNTIRYSHFQDKPSLAIGDNVNIFDQIGKVGNTGNSTGSHLHLELRSNQGFGMEGSSDPLIYFQAMFEQAVQNPPNMRTVQYLDDKGKVRETVVMTHDEFADFLNSPTVQPRSDNTQYYQNTPNPYETPTTDNAAIPTKALQLLADTYVLNNRVIDSNTGAAVPVEQNYNTGSILKESYARTDLLGFDAENHNKVSNNYGYAYLARNPSHAKKLNQVATELKIPAVWLADIIAFESKFDPSIQNIEGATGLIQFFPKSGNSGMTWGGHTTWDLADMSFIEQMDVVKNYLKSGGIDGNIKSLPLLAAAVFGGAPLVKEYLDDPATALKKSDGYVTLEQYIKHLGRPVQRQYDSSHIQSFKRKIKPIHTEYVTGCAVCGALQSSGSSIVPHQGAFA